MKLSRRALLTSSLALAACAGAPAPSAPLRRSLRGPVVLVPGTGAGKWAYEALAQALRARGRDAVTVALPGMGERVAEIAPEIDCNVHADDLAKQIRENDWRDVTLVGHSYGGMPITGAVGRAKDRITSLVWLDAYVPNHGQSLVDLDAEFGAWIKERVDKDGAGWKIPRFDGAHFHLDDEARADFDAHVTECPYAMYTAKLFVDERSFASVHKGYVSCNQFGYFIKLGEEKHAAGWPLAHLPYGHLSCITNPDETAAAILEVDVA